MILSQAMINSKKLLWKNLTVNWTNKLYLENFYKHQIFFSYYKEKLKINAQFSTSYNEDKIYSTTQPNSFDFKSIENRINGLYAQPTRDVFLIYDYVNREYDKSCMAFNYTKIDGFKCTIDVTWPHKASFSAIASSKKEALHSASILCLDWLHELKRVKNLKPVLYDNKTMRDLLDCQQFVEINITPGIKAKMEILIKYYNDVIKSRIATSTSELNENNLEDKLEDDFSNVESLRRNDNILELKKGNKQETPLSINIYKKEILNSLQNNQVLLIKGDTGCGKSTQIPQFILDSYIEKGKTYECNIFVAQPRRISAVSLSYYVAKQRKELLGTTVGFQVRLSKRLPRMHGSILFCTNGILLQKLNCTNILEKVSHIIIDEAHERSIEIDILLKLLKDRLKYNPHLKLIIMSASMNTEIFQQYFSCPVINIPGKFYDVKMHFLDDIDIPFNKSLDYKNNIKSNIFFDKIINLIELIITKKPPGGILCFVPGWNEIIKLRDLLENKVRVNNDLLILPLHSKLSFKMQEQIFKEAPVNTTKIVLATDIAETGITIPDISYVIDTAVKKDQFWNETKSLASLQYNRISQASILQRKGRAGRLKPGESYHLITREEYDKLDVYPKPMLLKCELDRAIINAKTMTKEKIYDFFDSMIDSPSTASITYAILKLRNYGILDKNENLTGLGKRVSQMSLNLELSKAVVLSCVFQCLNPILLLAIIFSNDKYNETLLVENSDTCTDKRANRRKYHETSDHIAILKEIEDKYISGHTNSFFTFNDNEKKLKQLYTLHLNELEKSKMISSIFNISDMNLYSKNNELIQAVLFAATHYLIKNNAYGVKNGYFTKKANIFTDEKGKNVKIKNESVNSSGNIQPNELLTYINKIDFALRRSVIVCDTSIVSPLSVLLFSQGHVYCKDITDIFTNQRNVIMQIDNINNLNLICEDESAKVLLKFRSILWNIIDFIIKYEGEDDYKENLYEVKRFKNDLIDLILRILNKSSICTDNESD